MTIWKFLISGVALVSQCLVASADTIEPSPLAAHYRETVQGADGKTKAADWYLQRRTGELGIARGKYAEVWKRDERGEIALTRVFHEDGKLVAYNAGELRTQRRYPEWNALNAVFDPRSVSTLKPVQTTTWLGRAATRYKGTFGGHKTEVVWLDQEAVVAKMTRQGENGRTVLELKTLRPSADKAWPKTVLDGTQDYALIDGADFGDMESDPFVQRVMARDNMRGGEGGHAHHH